MRGFLPAVCAAIGEGGVMAYRTNFEKLIEYYADGRQVCNCRNAYYKNCGHGIDGGVERHDLPTCEHGCSANQIRAKEYIADRVVADLTIQGKKKYLTQTVDSPDGFS